MTYAIAIDLLKINFSTDAADLIKNLMKHYDYFSLFVITVTFYVYKISI